MTFRSKLLVLHRWAGIALAAFVVLAGLTGSFLAFYHEIDAEIVPELHKVRPATARASLDAVGHAIESRHPALAIGYFVFPGRPDRAVKAVMNSREAADQGKLDREAAGHLEVYFDPHTGRLLGERRWGEIGGTRAHIVPMVYRLHMSLFLEEAGQWTTAIVAGAWILAMLGGVVLALPNGPAIRKALLVKWRAAHPRVFFDLHRTAGLAGFVVLAVSAFTGLYMNIPQVVEPAVAAVSPFTRPPPPVRTMDRPREEAWRIGWEAALGHARLSGAEGRIAILGRVESRGFYQARFLVRDEISDAGTFRVFVDGRDGRIVGTFDHRQGSAADKIRMWQWPLHSGYAFGLPGRVAICIAGFLPLVLAFTGLWLWIRRRRLRASGAWMPSPGLGPYASAAPGSPCERG